MPPWLVHIQQCRNTLVTWLVTIPLDVTRSGFICVTSPTDWLGLVLGALDAGSPRSQLVSTPTYLVHWYTDKEGITAYIQSTWSHTMLCNTHNLRRTCTIQQHPLHPHSPKKNSYMNASYTIKECVIYAWHTSQVTTQSPNVHSGGYVCRSALPRW